MPGWQKNRMVLGVTGSFGSGKTTVARMLKRLGAVVIDADEIYHRLLKPKQPLYKKIVSVFGPEILKKNKQIDRKTLAEIVFNGKQSLQKLCRISHPIIIAQIKNKLRQIKGRIAVIDAPLLIEAGLAKIVDKLLVVKINRKKQIERCAKQRKLSQAFVLKRIRLQMPMREKIKLANYVIDNNGTLSQTRDQVREIWRLVK